LSIKTKVNDLSVVWPQNHWNSSPSLASNLMAMGFPVWAYKRQLRFGDLGLKITMAISYFGPQNQAGNGLSVAP
jgi:hypothetical protein